MPARNGTRRPVPKTIKIDIPVELFTSDDDPYSETEPLFAIDGTVYEIPVEMPVAYLLRYSAIWMDRGISEAITYALRTSLGEDGYTALTGHRALTQAQLNKIVGIVLAKFDGSSDPKGRRSNGSSTSNGS